MKKVLNIQQFTILLFVISNFTEQHEQLAIACSLHHDLTTCLESPSCLLFSCSNSRNASSCLQISNPHRQTRSSPTVAREAWKELRIPLCSVAPGTGDNSSFAILCGHLNSYNGMTDNQDTRMTDISSDCWESLAFPFQFTELS